ncbi:MAG TPA: hypothetical protein VI076_13000 [Actinopolymorphaceae bacterium]
MHADDRLDGPRRWSGWFAVLRREAPQPVTRLPWPGVGLLVCYAIGLGLSEYFVIGPAFDYLGFEFARPDWSIALILLVPYVLCARRLPVSWERASTIVYWMLFLVVVASVHVMPVFIEDVGPSMWVMVASIDVAFWLLGGIYSLPLASIPRPRVSGRLFWWSFAAAWAGLLVLIAVNYGDNFNFSAFFDIYGQRAHYRAQLEETSRFVRYSVTWVGNVIAPIALARGLLARKWLWAVAAVLTELFLVGMTGFKQLMFSSVLVIAVVLLVKFTDIRKIGARIAVLVSGGVILLTLAEWVLGMHAVSSIVVRRLVLTAGLNTQYFFEFFSDHDKANLGYGLLSGLVDYPYSLNPAYLIGAVYYGNAATSANVNVWADAFANFGVPGVLAFTGLLAVVLYLADSLSSRLVPGIGVAALALTSFSLSNTALLTVLLTHGLLLVLACLYLMPAEEDATGTSPRVRRTGRTGRTQGTGRTRRTPTARRARGGTDRADGAAAEPSTHTGTGTEPERRVR